MTDAVTTPVTEDYEALRAERDALRARLEAAERRPGERHRVRGVVAGLLVGLAIVAFLAAMPGLWANRNLLDTDRFVTRAGPLVDDPDVQEVLATRLTAEVMKLVAKILRNPDFPAAELEQYRNERLADLEAERREPDELARNELARHGNPYPKGDPRHVASFDEAMAEMRAVTLEQVRAFHKDFYGAGATEFAEPGVKSKSVSSLLRRNPRTMMRLPNVASIVVVIEATLPSASTIVRWLVPAASVSPGRATRMERSPISFALESKYFGSRSAVTGMGWKAGSPRYFARSA